MATIISHGYFTDVIYRLCLELISVLHYEYLYMQPQTSVSTDIIDNIPLPYLLSMLIYMAEQKYCKLEKGLTCNCIIIS